jgi:rare lipoprotein A
MPGHAVVGWEFRIQNSEFRIAAMALVIVMMCAGCAHKGKAPAVVKPSQPPSPPVEEGWTEKGIASWYGEPYHGRRTASGEIYDMHEMTAAHKTLAFGSMVKVNRRDTGADVVVRINDRGPFIEGRIIDLSFAAAKKIGLDVDGVAPVKIKVVGREDASTRSSTPPAAGESEDCFWVQVAAFSERNRAARAEADLESTGERATVLEGLDELWRVRLGPFDNEDEAERTRNRVTNAWPGAHVTPCGG